MTTLNRLFVVFNFALLLQVASISGQLLKAQNHQIADFSKDKQGTWNGSYIFVQGTDPQPGLIDMVEGGNGTKWEEEIRLLKKAVSTINDMKIKPKFFFISGDIINAYPGEEPYRSEQTRDVLDALTNITVPTVVISGNHDLLNAPTPDSIELFREQYGDDYYSFYCGGVFYIALNSQYFFNSSQVKKLAQEQMDWLDNELNQAAENPELHDVVIFMHIPIFLQEIDEDDTYFTIPQTMRKLLVDKFIDAGIKIIFSGHYHRNAGGVYRKTIDGKEVKLEIVVTSAIGAQLGTDDSGMRVVEVGEDQITHEYHALDNLKSLSIK